MTERLYHNPIIRGTHPDPSICRVGEDYYICTSTFACFPAAPIFHSRDLVHWRQIGHALTRREQLPLDGVAIPRGMYAPSLRHINGRLYMITTLMGHPQLGCRHLYVSTEDPAGEWSDAVWIDQVIDTIGLRDRLDHRPSELSGGQQQRVAVARALASKPAIIFADEPTGNLDSKTGGEVLSFMRRAVTDLGQTIVMVTHDAVAASYADRIVFLKDGKIAGEMTEPTPDRVLDYLKHLGE